MTSQLSTSFNTDKRRSPDLVMRLDRLGSMFPTRLSFMPTLVRRMAREDWHFKSPIIKLDAKGVGHVLIGVSTGERDYTLIAYSHDLAPAQRSDRVIATAWDATFTLFDGIPTAEDISRLAKNVPFQEAGRCSEQELVLSRANRSVRLFEHVVEALAQGRQPDREQLRAVGYLMRTTAVYGNGKFGLSDRARFADRPEFRSSFMVEMLAVYLIRLFSFAIVEHMAKARNPEAAELDDEIKTNLGIGNSTGLGMAPFLVSHPALIDAWFGAREEALARVMDQPVSDDRWASFTAFAAQVQTHLETWDVPDQRYQKRIAQLKTEVAELIKLDRVSAWQDLVTWSQDKSLDLQELLVSLLIEPFADLVDDLAETFDIPAGGKRADARMSIASLKRLIDTNYAWAQEFDFAEASQNENFWYVSEEKLEPRFGKRFEDPGAELETPLAIARDIQALRGACAGFDDQQSCAELMLQHPEFRHLVARVQGTAGQPFAEIRDNLIGAQCLPIDILRAKLAYFGASRFDPKSDLWTRITMYRGAPLPHELSTKAQEPWYLSAGC